MKHFKLTIFLFALAIAIGSYTFWDYRQQKSNETTEAKKDQMFPNLDFHNITKIDVYRREGVMTIAKDNGKWMAKQPIQDIADETQAVAYARQIVEENVQALELATQPDLKKYGLSDGSIRIVLTEKGGKTHEFFISTEAAFDGSRYLRRKDESQVYVGDKKWSILAEKPLQDLRSRVLFPPDTLVSKVEIRFPGLWRQLNLVKENDQWRATEFKQYKMSNAAIEELVKGVLAIRISSFVVDEATDEQEARHRISKNNMIKINDRTINYGVDKGNLYMTINDRPGIFRIEIGEKAKWEKTISDLRDKTVPFQWDGDVQRLSLKTRKQWVELVKADGKWKLPKDDPNKHLDVDKVEQLLGETKKLVVKDYSWKTEIGGGSRLQLKDGTQNTIFELVWGDKSTSKNKDNGEVETYMVKSNLLNDAFTVPAEEIDRVLDVQLVMSNKDKEKEKEAKKPVETKPAAQAPVEPAKEESVTK